MALPQFEDSKLTGSSEIAKTLGILRTKRGAFTPEQQSAYTNLQNAVMGLPTEKTADAYIKELAGLLETTPDTKAPETTPIAANQDVGVAESTAPKAPSTEVSTQEAETASGLRFIERDRMGISFGVSKSSVPEAETPVPSASNESVPEEATVSEVSPAPAPAVIETPVEAPVLEPSAEVPVQSPEPANTFEQIERPSDIEAIAKEVALISESLNVFAHGRGLQWLRNPDTGYREYMTKLIAAREAIDNARKGKGNADLKAMVDELRTLSEGVRRAVGGEMESNEQPAIQTSVPGAAEPQEQVVPDVASSPAIGASQETPDLPVPEETPAPVVEQSNETIIPIQTQASATPEAVEPLNIYEQPRVDTEVPQPETVAEELPVVEVPQEVPVQTEVPAAEENSGLGFSADTNAADVPKVTEEQAQAPLTPDAPLPNPEIYSPQVKGALNDLLTEWLGHTGWIVRKSGLDHPHWHKMAPLTVGQILAAGKDGQAIAGLDFATIENLAQNLSKWGQLYGISMLQHEDTTIDEIMHRIVFESLKQ